MADRPLPFQPTLQDKKDSKALDSPELREKFGADKLPVSADGTTTVTFKFADTDKTADYLCHTDPHLYGKDDCSAPAEKVRNASNAAMSAIMKEAGVKVQFVEVVQGRDADIVFVERDGDLGSVGHAGKSGGQSFIALDGEDILKPSNPGFSPYNLTADAIEKISQSVSRRLREKTAAHEIEHIFGAKHVDLKEPGNQKTLSEHDAGFNRTIVNGHFINDEQLLGPVDIAWYQRHFDKRETSESAEIAAPKPVPAIPVTVLKTR